MIKDLKKVDLSTTAVLVIDMQKDFLAPGFPFYAPMGNEMMHRMAPFLDQCRAAGLKLIYTQHGYRPDGSDFGLYRGLCSEYENMAATIFGTKGDEIMDEVAPKDGDIVVPKHCFNAFHGTDMDFILRSLGIKTVVITGVNTDQCCFSTARGAIDLGYDILFLSDMTATKDLPDMGFGPIPADQVHRTFLTEIAAASGRVCTSADFLSIL